MSRKRVDPYSVPVIAERLRRLRRALGFSQAGIAADVGMTPNSWNNYERGYSRINLDAVIELRRRYGISLDWVYLGIEAMMPYDLMQKIHTIEEE